MNPDDLLLDEDAIDWLDPIDAPLRADSALDEWAGSEEG